MSQEIFEFIGQIIAIGGGAAAIAYAVFIFFGKKWIEDRSMIYSQISCYEGQRGQVFNLEGAKGSPIKGFVK